MLLYDCSWSPCSLHELGRTPAGCAEQSLRAAAECTPAPGRRSTTRALVALPPLAHVVAWTAALLDAHFVSLAMQPAGRKVWPDFRSAKAHLRPSPGTEVLGGMSLAITQGLGAMAATCSAVLHSWLDWANLLHANRLLWSVERMQALEAIRAAVARELSAAQRLTALAGATEHVRCQAPLPDAAALSGARAAYCVELLDMRVRPRRPAGAAAPQAAKPRSSRARGRRGA